MYELIKAGESTWYVTGPTTVGVYVPDGAGAYLIDSGGNAAAGRRILGLLSEKGWRVKAVFNTHSHADHTGGSRYIQENTGCRVFCPGCEWALASYPELESALVFGAKPCREFRSRFMLAEECRMEMLTEDVLPAGLRSLRLGGHMPDLTAFSTADGVWFLGDALADEQLIGKYGVIVAYDIGGFYEAAQVISGLEGDLFIASHARPVKDAGELVKKSLDCMDKTLSMLLELCREPRTMDEIIRRAFEISGVEMNLVQHALIGSTLRSCLSYLHDGHRIDPDFSGNVLRWKTREAKNAG